MPKQTELMVPDKTPQALARTEPTVGEMLSAIIDKGITSENAGALERIAALYERMEAKKAEREFNTAFVKLQSELPVIVASTVIPNRGKYERYEDVWNKVSEPLQRNGFSVSFTNSHQDNRIIETCHLRHVGGHSQSNSFAVRVGRADTETQADCKAATTAKRNALCNALNIVIRQDVLNEENDAGIEGDPNAKVSAEVAFELERRVKETNSNVAAFLSFSKAKTFEDIPANLYPELDAMLERKERQGR